MPGGLCIVCYTATCKISKSFYIPLEDYVLCSINHKRSCLDRPCTLSTGYVTPNEEKEEEEKDGKM